jgi:hypothetical protein
MREIIYIQAGTLANYTGTHFWNTQETYLFDTEVEEPLHDTDVSFREGLSQTVRVRFYLKFGKIPRLSQGQPTLCPRLLVFDRKGQPHAFGEDRP